MLSTTDDTRFLREFEVYVDVLKEQKLGFAQNLVSKLLTAFRRKLAIEEEQQQLQSIKQR